jgi:pimeloyl-ACP methyl ester carboxylesterase
LRKHVPDCGRRKRIGRCRIVAAERFDLGTDDGLRGGNIIRGAGGGGEAEQECGQQDKCAHDRGSLFARSSYAAILRRLYRENADNAPAILLLHGFPSSSRMFDTLIPLLADRYHLIAPDYPGFGNSEAPSPETFSYTFDAIADIVDGFTQAIRLDRYALYLQNYGGPVGYRVAVAHPERVTALIIQNAIAHEEGLGRLQAVRKGFWADRAANEDKYRAGLASLEVARLRHVNGSPHPERYNPDLWKDEAAFLARPGEADIQSDLFYDYRNNLAAFPAWQNWLRERRPPTLIVWGRYDPVFDVCRGHCAQERCAERGGASLGCRTFRAR